MGAARLGSPERSGSSRESEVLAGAGLSEFFSFFRSDVSDPCRARFFLFDRTYFKNNYFSMII